MGRKRKFSPLGLRKGVEGYFASITRRVKVTEMEDTGKKDKYGHAILSPKPVINTLGQEVFVTEYIIPPSVASLCEFLKIHPSTWAEYSNHEDYPEFTETTSYVYERLKAWNERELVTRPGKDINGIKFNLENNYGYKERQTVDLSGGGVEAYLRKLAEEGEEAREF